ncbi:85/88 kDa calcium-independent phospholipase A2 [Nilaparvata lugens]|uniref:85/88 kDa calcium-independent phospholipase A2 n=1 Tax=Nilaparvata lugens TaxID=108931 RepID=UPI00193D0511|nr:85/88 kDa calcium-independent phospholipase A2 [Nilaparvata lugens]
MSWFEVSSVFRNIQSSFLNSITNNNKVIEEKQLKYTDCAVICREEDLILYQNQTSSDIKYDIVLLRPHSDQAYSLHRSKELDDAQVQYIALKDKLPLLVSVMPSACNANSIQKIVDLLREKQSWSVGHMIVHFKWSNCVTHPIIQSFLNVSDLETGMTPIQLAIQNRDIAIVRQLIVANASLDLLDNQRNSVFHYAASSNKEIALALVEAKTEDEVKKFLNERNADGYTPLHIACQTDNPDCVKTFLQSGADCNITAAKFNPTSQQSASSSPGYVADFMKANQNKLHIQDMKFGGTPLHWSCSREVIETLVDRNCDVNALNFDGKTALHMMVMRNRLACVVALLSRHAEVNITDEDGNTALHLAVGEKNIAIVQALIVFGADINHLNNNGFTPRHLAALENDQVGEKVLYILHAVGASRCDSGVLGCTDGCARSGTYNGQAPPTPIGQQARAILRCFENHGNLQNLKETKGGRLLCLDGGGIRGLILVSILLNLESAVNRPIIHCFDWLAGTSTGAILALGLAAGKTLKECQCLYFRMKDYAFSGTRPYSSEPLEDMLKNALGSDTVMSDIRDVKVMITAVLADRKPVDMHLFRNYENPSEIIDPNPSYGSFLPPTPRHEQFLWHAARASGAAPSYFKSCDRFIDGGLIANNPTLDALTEIHEYNLALKTVGRGAEAKPLTVVVSIGTGCVPVTAQSKRVEIFRPESPMDGMKFLTGVSALANLLVDQATQADGRVIDRCRSWCSMINVPFFRFSPQLSEDIAMDEKSDEKLVNMLWETLAYMISNKKEVQKLAILLNYELDGSKPMECNNQ